MIIPEHCVTAEQELSKPQYPIVEASQNHTRSLCNSRAGVCNAPYSVARLLGLSDMPSGAWDSKKGFAFL